MSQSFTPNPFLDGSFPDRKVILENEHCVFVPTPQAVLAGSGLIVPLCRETPFDLTPEERAATFELLRRVKAQLDETLAGKGVRYFLKQPANTRP